MNQVYIGTSGYSYPYWKNRFYPEKLPASRWLSHYATRFNTVELNHTFYRMPTVAALKKAAVSTPDNFVFSVKANRFITHIKRMRGAEDLVKEFVQIVTEGLEAKLGCILYQMPPTYSYTPERLDELMVTLRYSGTRVVEFRHQSWWQEAVYQRLEDADICFCSVSFPGLPEVQITTGKLLYQRMHGVPELFNSAYNETDLKQLADTIPNVRSAFVYFNNTYYEAGYTNAATLQNLLKP